MCRSKSFLLVPLAAVAIAGCGAAADGKITAQSSAKLARWTPMVHTDRPLDVVPGTLAGTLVMEAHGRLFLVRPPSRVTRIDTAYTSPGGEEPYIASGSFHRCGFGFGTIYAIRLAKPRGVVAVAGGAVRHFASISAPGLIDGITFDETGAFGHRLLVTINHGLTTTVDAIDCHGRVSVITATAPRVEGGIAVAPKTFGRFAGDLIAPDEQGGRIFAISPSGSSTLVANSGLPHGGDIGVESEAFVPDNKNTRAVLADRLTPGNRHPGDNVLLSVGYAALHAAGVRPGDLLVATEGGALTDAVSCGPTACTVRHVANGPAIAHAEGHIAFVGF